MAEPSRPLRRIVRRVLAAQAALAVLLVAIAVALAALVHARDDAADRARDARIALQRLRGDVLSGETGLRGYALTGADAFLEPYLASVAAVDRGVLRLRPLLAPGERPWLDAADREVLAWRRSYAVRLIALVDDRRPTAAAVLARTGLGKRRIDAFREDVARLDGAVQMRASREAASARRVLRDGLVLIALAGVAVVAGGVLLRRRLVSDVVAPVEALAGAAQRFGAGEGDATLAVRAPAGGATEIATAVEAFNAMAGRLEGRVSDLVETDAMRRHFVAAVSHELRTPLTAIGGHADELRSGELGPLDDEQREAVEVIARNVGTLGGIIDDLLLLAALESGSLVLGRDAVAVDALAAELCDDLRPAAAARGIDLRLTRPEGGAAVVAGDGLRLRQSLGNLLSNAIKFSPDGAAVDVRIRRDSRSVVAEVEDRGVGIPAAEVGRIAERFFRASTATGTKGTGLGLAITRELVERHGGQLHVASQEGRGSTFRVVLPAAATG